MHTFNLLFLLGAALMSIIWAGCGKLVNISITLETHGIFGSKCAYLFKGGKHVFCDVIFVIVRVQPYWKQYQYVLRFSLFIYKTKVLKSSNQCVS